ncbi:pullulanase [Bacillus sp. FJAT-27916]|uniref:type I pullulanase n=1 Tax=Bacillus sp. FJAT-27916 TaxID=1679169 RepID=UPI0006709898|nr:type I pullulanase [Bacillus sp. FJAT-27916]KMY43933.1 pullulanase [Bacillus sp. FJAT-27916]
MFTNKKRITALLAVFCLLFAFFPELSIRADVGKTEITVHYQESDGNEKDWNLWVWAESLDGHVQPFTGEDEFGKVAHFTLDGTYERVGFIVRTDAWEKDGGDRWIEGIEDGKAEVWVMSGDDKVYYSEPSNEPVIKKASMDDFDQIAVTTNIPLDIRQTAIELSGADIQEIIPADGKGNVTNQFTLKTKKKLDVSGSYQVRIEGYGEQLVEIGKIVRTEAFDRLYYYDGQDLGNTYSRHSTKFRLWAPTASEAKLVVYSKWDDKTGREIKMKRGEKGTWTAKLRGNQNGLLYTYKVKIGDKWNEAVDPYVRAASANGLRGAVIDLSETNPKGWAKHKKPKLSNPEESIIYELHVRDLSIQPESGIKQKGKFLGVTEKGTKGPNGLPTGLDHIKSLGVTHVQFLPIYDYKTVDETKLDQAQYNWGYDPQNFNVPEGSYSTNPYDPAVRIQELKQMVQTLHGEGLRVVMDVVYNHMFDAAESNFQKLVPGYYYRYNEDGTLANGTGVGNDTASERKMMRKFIVDSSTYWANEYKLDGFRFDLMGIHDVKTMNLVRKELKRIDPAFIVHGEGWDLNTPLPAAEKANQKNAAKMPGIGHFNDDIRDGLKGSVFIDQDNGFINGKANMEDRIKKGIMAGLDYDPAQATYQDPEQVLTYVEAHDNHTLWDKLELTNPEAGYEEKKQRHKLASSIILTSQGISFIHAGQEFMRTKYGDHNSYKSPDSINQMDWKRNAAFSHEVDYMRGLIDLRKKHAAFRMTTASAIKEHIDFLDAPANVIAYTIDGEGKGKYRSQYFIAHNANNGARELTLPANASWKVLVDGENASAKSLYTIKGEQLVVPAMSTVVLQTEVNVKKKR